MKAFFITYLKGIVVGFGGIAPGLSGTVLMIIFGMYRRMLDALGNFFKDIKGNGKFLLPLVLGMFTGVLLFSNLIDFLMAKFEMPTAFCFLGLILGTVPMIWKEVRKEGFSKIHYGLVALSAVACFAFFRFNPHLFPDVTDPSLLQSVILGVAVAATAIVPGVDPMVCLTTLGLYNVYIDSLANFDLTVLAPMLIGLAAGALGISFCMSLLFKRFYTATFSVIFGAFLSMIPNILTENCMPGWNVKTVISFLLLIAGFLVSYFLGRNEKAAEN